MFLVNIYIEYTLPVLGTELVSACFQDVDERSEIFVETWTAEA